MMSELFQNLINQYYYNIPEIVLAIPWWLHRDEQYGELTFETGWLCQDLLGDAYWYKTLPEAVSVELSTFLNTLEIKGPHDV